MMTAEKTALVTKVLRRHTEHPITRLIAIFLGLLVHIPQSRAVETTNTTVINPIAVPGLEPAARKLSEQTSATFSSYDQVPRINYIRHGIPEAHVPTVTGDYYEAMVPDTVNLAGRMGLVVHHMTEIANPKADYEIFYVPDFHKDPPRFHMQAGSGQLWPKYMESLPLMRIASGSTKDLQVDKAWAKVILHSIGPDGRYYLPLVGRPWDPPKAFGSPDRGAFRGAIHVHGGRMLGVLALNYQMTGDPVWLEAGKRMVDGLAALTVNVEDKAVTFETYYFPGDTLPPDAEKRAAEQLKRSGLFSWDNSLYTTWVVTGLAQFYGVSHYEPAKELALRLARALRAQYPDSGEWYGHQHCGTLAIHAFAELALATGDRDFAELARKTYDWARNKQEMGAIPEIGYFPVMQKRTRSSKEPMEPCSIGDMTAIAVKLTQLGWDEYFEDVDQYSRNGLIEAQFYRLDQITDFRRKIAEGRAKGYGMWSPLIEKMPVAYSESNGDFANMVLGMFSSTTFPNELNPLPGYDLCCTGNDSRALYYAWESIAQHKDGELKINLLMNRASEWADIDSFIPYVGRVDITIKKPLSLKVRMNDWIPKDQVTCKVAGKLVELTWTGSYAAVGAAQAGQIVRFDFPIKERETHVKSFDLEYDVTFRGSDVVDLQPSDANTPLFQRGYYRDANPRYVKETRFVCNAPVRW